MSVDRADIEAIRQGWTDPTPSLSTLMAENMQLRAEIERLRAENEKMIRHHDVK